MPTDQSPAVLDPDTHRQLVDIKDAATRLWPYVRYFGLCGADPKAVRAALDLGRCLGVEEMASAAVAETATHVRSTTIDEVAHWLSEHRFTGRKIRRSDMKRLTKELLQSKEPTHEHRPTASRP